MKKKLLFADVLSNAFTVGLKNFLPLLGAVILWGLTCWIPYLNVGTTIAMTTLPALLSEGKMIKPLDIFNANYRKSMGEYFLVSALMSIIISMGFMFVFIPGIVMAVTYSFAPLLVVSKGKGASEALKLSSNMTYGNKWIIFLVPFALIIPLFILSAILPILGLLYYIALFPILIAATGYIYGILSSDIENE